MTDLNEFFDKVGPPTNKKRGPTPGSRQPENIIQEAIMDFLTLRGWFVININQTGLPDLYCCHLKYGKRWVEVKRKGKYRLTKAQLETFPKFSAKNVGIWILTAATKGEYAKLFGPPNWHMFLGVMK